MEASNVKEMREALSMILGIADHLQTRFAIPKFASEEILELEQIAESALSAPPRNVDVGTAEEQERRWHSNCGSGIPNCKHCKVYEQARKSGLVDDKNMIRFDCRFIWSQMPYEETKGDVK